MKLPLLGDSLILGAWVKSFQFMRLFKGQCLRLASRGIHETATRAPVRGRFRNGRGSKFYMARVRVLVFGSIYQGAILIHLFEQPTQSRLSILFQPWEVCRQLGLPGTAWARALSGSKLGGGALERGERRGNKAHTCLLFKDICSRAFCQGMFGLQLFAT